MHSDQLATFNFTPEKQTDIFYCDTTDGNCAEEMAKKFAMFVSQKYKQ